MFIYEMTRLVGFHKFRSTNIFFVCYCYLAVELVIFHIVKSFFQWLLLVKDGVIVGLSFNLNG